MDLVPVTISGVVFSYELVQIYLNQYKQVKCISTNLDEATDKNIWHFQPIKDHKLASSGMCTCPFQIQLVGEFCFLHTDRAGSAQELIEFPGTIKQNVHQMDQSVFFEPLNTRLSTSDFIKSEIESSERGGQQHQKTTNNKNLNT